MYYNISVNPRYAWKTEHTGWYDNDNMLNVLQWIYYTISR